MTTPESAAAPAGTVGAVVLPEVLDEDMIAILGRVCFECRDIARLVNPTGPRKAEVEQATTIHWLLKLYLRHGPSRWRDEAERELDTLLNQRRQNIVLDVTIYHETTGHIDCRTLDEGIAALHQALNPQPPDIDIDPSLEGGRA